jgi:hypothetical protein
LPMLTITGNWVGLSGVKANGNFQANLVFIPSGEHVGEIVAGSFDMTGKYTGRR